MSPYETVYTTVHEAQSTSKLNRVKIVYKSYQTKVDGTVYKPCKCPVNRVNVVFNRTRPLQTELDRT